MKAKISFIVITVILFAISKNSFGQKITSDGTGSVGDIYHMGNIGIGTNNPLKLLHLNGTNPAIRLTDEGTINWDIENNSSSLKFKHNGANKFSISSNGNLFADAYKDGGNRLLFTDNNGTFSPLAGGKSGQVLQTGINGELIWNTIYVPTELWLLTKAGNTILKNGNGNIGIGISNAEKQLHIFRDFDVSRNFATIRLESREKRWLEMGVPSRIWDVETKENGLFFSSNSKENPYSSDFKFVFGRNGNFGIGTTKPYTALHVKRSSPILRLENKDRSAWDIRGGGALNFGYSEKGYPTEYLATFTREGRLGIGTSNPQAKLHIVNGNTDILKLKNNGHLYVRELIVQADNQFPDYVFEPNYKPIPLNKLENFIKTNKHLPEVPSAKEVAKNGLQIGEMNTLLLKKVEELTLYTIEQQKLLEKQQKQIDELKSLIK